MGRASRKGTTITNHKNLVMLIKNFFIVLGLGLGCTAFAKSLALALDGFDLYTVHYLSSNEKDLGRIISREKRSR